MTTFDFAPDWAKGIVWYQIFPERFWNGDPANDPRLEDQAGSWPHDQVLCHRGDFTTVLVDDAQEVYAFQRSDGEQRALVLINRGAQIQQVVLPAGEAGQFLDVLNGGKMSPVENGALALEVAPLWGCILLVT